MFADIDKARQDLTLSHASGMSNIEDAIRSLNTTMFDSDHDETERKLAETGAALEELLNSL